MIHSRRLAASHLCAAAMSWRQTAEESQPLPPESADPESSSKSELPGRRTQSARFLNASRESLVHRGGFEPSYLRGGADLQSAGFNHSPTCAEMPIARLSTFPAAFARVATCARRGVPQQILQCKEPQARKTPLAHPSPQLEKLTWSAARNLPMPPRRANVPLFPESDPGAGEGI